MMVSSYCLFVFAPGLLFIFDQLHNITGIFEGLLHRKKMNSGCSYWLKKLNFLFLIFDF